MSYRGSYQEARDEQSGLYVGGHCIWMAEGYPVATIECVEIDQEGIPWFHLEFSDDHKPVRVGRLEIAPVGMRRAFQNIDTMTETRNQ